MARNSIGLRSLTSKDFEIRPILGGSGGGKERKGFSKTTTEDKWEASLKKGHGRGYSCARCSFKNPSRRYFEIAHDDGDRSNDNPRNCVILCRACNLKQGNKSKGRLHHLEGKNVVKKATKRTAKKKQPKRYDPFGIYSSGTLKW